MVSFKGPAFSLEQQDMAVLDLIAKAAFSSNSELYKRLFVRDRVVDFFGADFSDHVDPYLVSILARVRQPADVARVEREILETCASIARDGIEAGELERTKAALRYGFAAGLDSPAGIAGQLAGYVARTRSVDAVNRLIDCSDCTKGSPPPR
jgi:predicted Zn-dependent peptidase